MILCSLAGCLLHCSGNLMPNAFNKPRRPRYALSMTVLRRVIAVTTDKNKETIPASHCCAALCTSAMRPYARAFVPSASNPIDDVSTSIAIKYRSVYVRSVTSPGYLSTFSRHSLAAPRCKSDASPEVDNFLLNGSYTWFEKLVFTKIVRTVLKRTSREIFTI